MEEQAKYETNALDDFFGAMDSIDAAGDEDKPAPPPMKRVEKPWERRSSDGGTVLYAMQVITARMKKDPEYAWSWHCNITMASVDEGMEWIAANRAAARFMQSCFNVDTSKLPQYRDQFATT